MIFEIARFSGCSGFPEVLINGHTESVKYKSTFSSPEKYIAILMTKTAILSDDFWNWPFFRMFRISGGTEKWSHRIAQVWIYIQFSRKVHWDTNVENCDLLGRFFKLAVFRMFRISGGTEKWSYRAAQVWIYIKYFRIVYWDAIVENCDLLGWFLKLSIFPDVPDYRRYSKMVTQNRSSLNLCSILQKSILRFNCRKLRSSRTIVEFGHFSGCSGYPESENGPHLD